jgi:site-specific recombinase XerD
MVPETGRSLRHHACPSGIESALKKSVAEMEIAKKVTRHSFRRSFATRLLEDVADIHTVRELPGRADVRTTMMDLSRRTRRP